jgi:DNA-binding NarL/FixJ family response regulator
MAKIPKLKTPAEVGKTRVLIVDDQPIVRERFAQLINNEIDLAFCGEADNPRVAFELVEAKRPHLVVTGLALKGAHGLEFIKDLHARYPRVRVLVFSMYDESIYAERAIRAGASGFLTKRQPTMELVRAIRNVVAGEIYLSERIAGQALRRFFAHSSVTPQPELPQLSDRELEIFELIGRGRSSRHIASTLHIDIKTVETYRSRIKIKLGLGTAAELVASAQEFLRRTTSVRTDSQRAL